MIVLHLNSTEQSSIYYLGYSRYDKNLVKFKIHVFSLLLYMAILLGEVHAWKFKEF